MTIDEFIEKEINLLGKFKEYYKQQNKIDPVNFPKDFKHSQDWEEQFFLFVEVFIDSALAGNR